MAISKISDLNSLFNTLYEDAIFVARETNLMAGLVTNWQADTMANRQMGTYPTITAQEVSEGQDYQNPVTWNKTSSMTITPKIVQAQVTLTDERLMTDPQDARRDAATEMGGAIATKIDTDLAAEFANFTSTKGAAGSVLTVELCAAAMAALRAAYAPNPISIVLHPNQWFNVWKQLGKPDTNESFLGDTANEALRNYFVGGFINASWYTNGNIAVDASDDAVAGAFNRGAIALDTRTATYMEIERDGSQRGWEVNMVSRYGTGVRDDNFGVGITADATAPTGF